MNVRALKGQLPSFRPPPVPEEDDPDEEPGASEDEADEDEAGEGAAGGGAAGEGAASGGTADGARKRRRTKDYSSPGEEAEVMHFGRRLKWQCASVYACALLMHWSVCAHVQT